MSATIEERMAAIEEWKNMQEGPQGAINTELKNMNRHFEASAETMRTLVPAIEGQRYMLDRNMTLSGMQSVDLKKHNEMILAINDRVKSLEGTVREQFVRLDAKIDAKMDLIVELLRPKTAG